MIEWLCNSESELRVVFDTETEAAASAAAAQLAALASQTRSGRRNSGVGFGSISGSRAGSMNPNLNAGHNSIRGSISGRDSVSGRAGSMSALDLDPDGGETGVWLRLHNVYHHSSTVALDTLVPTLYPRPQP